MEESKKIPIKKWEVETGEYTICSAKHYGNLIQFNWRLNEKGYAITGKSIKMHKYVWSVLEVRDVPKGKIIDHKNSKNPDNRLDNRIENLRLLTRGQNNNNKRKKDDASSSFIGVSFNSSNQKYRALFIMDGKNIYLGYYENDYEAAVAYDVYIVQNNLVNEGRTLNFEDRKDEYLLMQPFKKRQKASNYHGVVKFENRFKAKITKKRKAILNFTSYDEKLCAETYDMFVVTHGLKKELNFPENFPNYKPTQFIRSFKVDIDEFTVKIILFGGKEVFISPITYDKIKYYKISHGDYVTIKVDKKTYQIHRFLTDEYDNDILVDHIDGDRFNNRLENLRKTDQQGNGENKKRRPEKKYPNVVALKSGKFSTEIKNNRIDYYKLHLTEEYAIRDRDIQIIRNAPDSLYNLYFKEDWKIPGEIEKWETLLSLEKLK